MTLIVETMTNVKCDFCGRYCGTGPFRNMDAQSVLNRIRDSVSWQRWDSMDVCPSCVKSKAVTAQGETDVT